MSSLVTTASDLVLQQSINERQALATATWSSSQKFLFRVAVIFFTCICVPNSIAWFEHVVKIDWTSLHYRDLYDIARFGSGINIFGNTIFGSSLLGYANWVTTLLLSIAGGLAWTWIARARGIERDEYQVLYYWLRVVVRYRAGIGIIGFGFTKLLPVQMPYPSLGLLNTDFGDFTAQKIYWLSIGIVPWYQVFAGVVEVLAGTLLLFRKTTAIGAILLFGALGDIVYVNFAYDGGVHVYSSYFVLLSAFLLIPEIPRLYNLLIREKFTQPFRFYPALPKWLKVTRIGLKAAVLALFLAVFFYLQLVNFLYDPYKQPSVAGVKELRGNYAVAEFRLNNVVLPADARDTVRWLEATFENWSTLTFRVNRPTPLDLSNGGGDPQRDVNRTFEVSGVAGGQRAFHYEADESERTLYLEDKYKAIPDRRNRTAGVGGDGGTEKNLSATTSKNKPATVQNSVLWKPEEWISPAARARIGNEVDKIDAKAQTTRRRREFAQAVSFENRNRMILQYHTTDNGNVVVLTGLNENKDSIKVVLNRINRNYALSPSTLNAGKY